MLRASRAFVLLKKQLFGICEQEDLYITCLLAGLRFHCGRQRLVISGNQTKLSVWEVQTGRELPALANAAPPLPSAQMDDKSLH